MTKFRIDGIEYPIVMYGYIDNGRILIEMVDMGKETAQDLLTNCTTIKYIKADGVVTDYSQMKFDGFYEGMKGKTMVILK